MACNDCKHYRSREKSLTEWQQYHLPGCVGKCIRWITLRPAQFLTKDDVEEGCDEHTPREKSKTGSA